MHDIKPLALGLLAFWRVILILVGVVFALDGCGEPPVSATAIIEGPFEEPLAVPPVVAGSTYPTLVAQETDVALLNGRRTKVYGYHAGLLGPTITVNTGDTVRVRLENKLGQKTNVHWHGVNVPPEMDGHPEQEVAPRSTFEFVLPIEVRAGTYWYHPHPYGLTAYQVVHGLAGFFIVHDDEEAALGLPSGEQDVAFVIQDKRFASDGELAYAPNAEEVMSGYFGPYLFVNGVYSPVRSVATRWYRMRILNGSTARVYNLALSDGAAFYVIGSDGGLIERPESVDTLLLAPGERAEILVTFSSYPVGAEVYLVSLPFDGGGVQGHDKFRIMKFLVERRERDAFHLPEVLSRSVPYPFDSIVQTRRFDIAGVQEMAEHAGHDMRGSGMHTIDHKTFDLERIDEQVRVGSTEIWEFDNSGGDEIHPMHIHGAAFRVFDRIGGRSALTATERGVKDTVLVMPGEKVRLLVTFSAHPGKFVFHCHNLEHEEDGMMLNYTSS